MVPVTACHAEANVGSVSARLQLGSTRVRVVTARALTPVLSQLGVDMGQLLGGVVVVETVFGLGGIGQVSVEAVDQDNLPVIIGFVIIAAIFVVIANIVVDLLYAALDPRVRIT